MAELKPWARPKDYLGPNWYGWFPIIGQHRDSDSVARSNWQVIVPDLERTRKDCIDTDGEECTSVLVVRDSHWAVGWVETLLVHGSDKETLARALYWLNKLESYPLADDMHYSDMCWKEQCEWWQRASVRERLEAIQRSRCDVSPFAARRSDFPSDDSGALSDYLRD